MQNTSTNPSSLTPSLAYENGVLCFDGRSLADIAKQHGSPLYVYSATEIRRAFSAYQEAAQGKQITICYAVKANSNIHILKLLGALGAHFDIVSAGELGRVMAAGISASKAVFAGVGKTETEIRHAIESGIGCFNVESEQEMTRIADIATSMQKKVNVSIRVNPDVDAKTHPYISTGLKENKFGISMDDARRVYQFAQSCPWLQVHGIDCHIGSQLTDPSPYYDALERVLDLVKQLSDQDGIEINHLDLGGGIGIRYKDETPPSPTDVISTIHNRVATWAKANNRTMPSLSFEPGRSIVGNAGVLLSEVQYLKQNGAKHFAIVDAAMNDLMRPALYGAYHGVAPVMQGDDCETNNFDLVGPVCETGDWLAKGRDLSLRQGSLVAFLSAGAYGQTMASNYNSRGRVAEVLIDCDQIKMIRRRETLADQIQAELDCE